MATPNASESPQLLIDGETRELIYRAGNAAPIRERKPQAITGTLLAPWDFLRLKLPSYDPLTAHVLVNRDAATVTLTLDERDELRDIIIGKLTLDDDVAALALNTDKCFTVGELRKLLKTNRRFFAEPDAHAVLLRNLETFSAKITKNIDDHKDTRGNSKKSVETAVAGVEMPESFVLKSRVYKNEEPMSYRVEIGYDVTDAGGVMLYLESVELIELRHIERERLLTAAVAPLAGWGCAVVYQS